MEKNDKITPYNQEGIKMLLLNYLKNLRKKAQNTKKRDLTEEDLETLTISMPITMLIRMEDELNDKSLLEFVSSLVFKPVPDIGIEEVGLDLMISDISVIDRDKKIIDLILHSKITIEQIKELLPLLKREKSPNPAEHKINISFIDDREDPLIYFEGHFELIGRTTD